MYINNWNKEIGQRCPRCGLGKLYLVIGKYGSFLGCTEFPRCKYTTSDIEKNNLYWEILDKKTKSKMLITGQPCRKCGFPIELRFPSRKILKPNQKYYFKRYFLCKKCKAMYMDNSTKVIIKSNKEIPKFLNVIKAPNPIPIYERFPRPKVLFLAGSIEMGKAERWQDKVCKFLKNTNWIILNPRRDDWDDSWVQSKDNKQFRQQVEWELEGQEIADRILIYFAPGTFAPISLLELGLAKTKVGLIVCCPEGFYRKGNVDIVCERYGILQIKKLEDIIKYL